MKKLIDKLKNKKIYIFLFLLMIYAMYIYYYYGVINLDSIIKHTVGSINLFYENIKYLVSHVFMDSKSLNTLILVGGVFLIIKFTNINMILKDVNYFEAPNIKFGINKDEKNNMPNESENENINKMNLEMFSENGNNEISNQKEEILKILIDNQEIVEIIELFINNPNDVVIPGNLIPSRYKMECIDKLFYWKMKPSSIKITGIKKNVAPYLIDTYQELKDRGFIYSTS